MRNSRKEIRETICFQKLFKSCNPSKSHGVFTMAVRRSRTTNVSLIIHPRSHRPLIRGSNGTHPRACVYSSERAMWCRQIYTEPRLSLSKALFSDPRQSYPVFQPQILLALTLTTRLWLSEWPGPIPFPTNISSNICSRSTNLSIKVPLAIFLFRRERKKRSGSQSEVVFTGDF